MNDTNEQLNRVADVYDVHPGEGLPHRAMSMSSVASSSVAATSVIGDLSDSSLNEGGDAGDETGNPSEHTEIDRHGFTGGSQYTDPKCTAVMSVEKIRIREQKWLSMLNNWDKWMSRRFGQVKNRCRKGIPQSLRGRAWQLLSGSKSLYEQNKGKYEEYLSTKADPNCIEDIEKDLHRQFPFHEMFVEKGGNGQQDLRDVLRAYSVYNPEDGYCQAQAPVAAVLLMHMPAEQAFWCMVAMCEYYLQGYFSPGLEALQVDGYVMQSLLRKVSPLAHRHLESHQVSPVLYMTEWFMCVFARTLPWLSVLRLWDMFFCEGIKVVFRCSLVLLRSTLGLTDKVRKLPGLYETMEALRKIDQSYMREDRLMFEIVNLKISERDLEYEQRLQKSKYKKTRGVKPPFLSAGKEGMRVYRYTPTFHQMESTKKHGPKSNSKKISLISANSSMIIEQTRMRKNPRKNNPAEEAQSDSKERTSAVLIANTFEHANNGSASTQSDEPVITSFASKIPEEFSDTSNNLQSEVVASEPKNQTDEITVF